MPPTGRPSHRGLSALVPVLVNGITNYLMRSLPSSCAHSHTTGLQMSANGRRPSGPPLWTHTGGIYEGGSWTGFTRERPSAGAAAHPAPVGQPGAVADGGRAVEPGDRGGL